jgi:hypothetical protein
VLSEVIVEKAFAKRLRWAASIYSFAKKRKLWGFQIVVLLRVGSDGVATRMIGCCVWLRELSSERIPPPTT